MTVIEWMRRNRLQRLCVRHGIRAQFREHGRWYCYACFGEGIRVDPVTESAVAEAQAVFAERWRVITGEA